MTSEHWDAVQAMFEAALQRPAAERTAFLDEACTEHAELRAEVASLLEAHDRAGDLLEAPAVRAVPGLFFDPGESLDGQMVGPYLVRHEIGRGGMGIVYLAEDTRLSRRVALKALPAALAGDPERRQRLRQEARTAALLSHPGIATVYALEEIGDQLFLACEYVPGQTLRALLESGPFAPAQVVDIACQLARALAAAHEHGVIHRDLKPENVVRTAGGAVKILDFGIAYTEAFARTGATQAGIRLGTPGYMSPEQICGGAVDHRTDIFAFGLLVYEMGTGSNPFTATTSSGIAARTLEFEPPRISSVSSTSPPGLDPIVSACLQKAPSARYQATRDLVADLEQIKSGNAHPPVTVPPARPPEAPLSARRWWAFHQGAMALLYVLMMFPAWTVRSWLPRPSGMLFLIGVLACASAATTVRLHLRFAASVYPEELAEQCARAARWTRPSDAIFGGLLLLAALGIEAQHPEFAMLLVGVGIAVVAASFMVEPATTKVALRTR